MNEEEAFNLEFNKIADAFIDLANQQAEETHPENVSMAILYAASRFNAYIVASNAENLEQYETELQGATDFFNEKYQEMLLDNLEDYKKMYELPE